MTLFSKMIKSDDIDFLKKIVSRYPELEHIKEDADSSPEGNQQIMENAFIYKIFDCAEISPNAIEAERTFFSLLLLKDVLNCDNKRFPLISKKSFEKMFKYVKETIKTEKDMEFCFYSLACNDLGKLKYYKNLYIETFHEDISDHDLLLAKLIIKFPDSFYGMNKNLSKARIENYKISLSANFNLGQFVQAENTPYNLVDIQKIKPKTKNLRLCTELFDFAGAAGHIDNTKSIVMTEDNLFSYLTAINELNKKPYNNSYSRYIKNRAACVGINIKNQKDFALSRIIFMARIFNEKDAYQAIETFNSLDENKKKILIEELNISGLTNRKSIIIYYAPAFICNSIKRFNDLTKGLKYSLNILAEIYNEANNIDKSGNGNIIINISNLAKVQ